MPSQAWWTWPSRSSIRTLLAIENVEQRRGVLKAHAVEPAAAHGNRVVVQAHERVAVGVRAERCVEPFQLGVRQPTGRHAVQVRVEHHEQPVAVNGGAADLERAPRERGVHRRELVVVAGDAVHRSRRGAEQLNHARVAGRIVLD